MITWKIESLSVKPQEGSHTDVVVTAGWRCFAADQGQMVSNYGSVGFSAPAENFIPYDSLTEADVLGWIWANGVDQAEVEANVSRELANVISPPVVNKPLPWSN